MANSAPSTAEAERREDAPSIEQKAELLANYIRESQHCIVFTGAGVATSAGIADFRGPNGVWTLRKQGRMHDLKSVDTQQALPTTAHMALVELQDRGLMRFLISQNCDGLHRKSGILPDRLAELHGNSNRESCQLCGKEYLRDFRAVAAYEKTVTDHRTGRKCARPGCDGVLVDSIINFGEPLPQHAETRARAEAGKADLCLVLGSSLTVTPANEIPEIVGEKRKARLVICNLQSTPLDGMADLRIFCEADVLMYLVMERIPASIPPFVLKRRLMVSMTGNNGQRQQLMISGVDIDQTPVTFLKSVKLEYKRRLIKSEPFIFDIRGRIENGTPLKMVLEFMGYYDEPNLEIVCNHNSDNGCSWHQLFELAYRPDVGNWTATVLLS